MAAIDVNLGDTHCVLDLDARGAVLHLSGHWAGANAAKLGRLFTQALSDLHSKLELSLEGCRSLDAQAVGMLLHLQRQIEALGKRMVVVNLPAALQSWFAGTALTAPLQAAHASAALEISR